MSAIATWQVALDNRLTPSSSSYSAGSGLTTFVTPCPFYGTTAVLLSDGTSHALTKVDDTHLTATGDLTGGTCVLGDVAAFSVDLSEVVARDPADKPEIDLGVLLKSVTVLHRSATGMSVQVAHTRSDLWPTETYSWAPDLTVAQASLLNRFRVRVGTVSERSTVSITESTWKPVSVAGLEQEIEILETIR